MPIIITEARHGIGNSNLVIIPVDRRTLTKRRWQITSPDGLEFGFDLQKPLVDGAVIYESTQNHYRLEQKPETVFCLRLTSIPQASRIAWSLGNLHFPLQVEEEVIYAPEDPAIKLFLERSQLPYTLEKRIFHPLSAAQSHHGHDHAH